MIYALFYTFIGFMAMEFSGWFIHKYIMHGILWKIHKTHHAHTKGFFELNDLFSLLFASIAIVLIFLGIDRWDYRFWLGLGITIYGMSYFFLHDVLIHRRLKLFSKPKKGYLAGIFSAHQAHHYSKEKDGAVSFGLFIVPKKYFKNKGR
ncbi:MAG: fatty acid hydroxylase [Cytophagales bacterium]|uniref:sterol desaturase family protein n=1 Tax=Cyclobacterium marinum TaxID=104 RepID=UPI0011F00C5A|nr:sterol desaturase family protein [Cyclobacterium marinum]MBI0401219.1 sterol desaturase family protein [Cyclobacterium marinum]MBR9777261.1 fatty acid hydroxylase [Cytophagales bacterium]|tara:strand:- start:8442 stop:8888 length:447 start_codon:yes stop_codon:yes gene_type:complete